MDDKYEKAKNVDKPYDPVIFCMKMYRNYKDFI